MSITDSQWRRRIGTLLLVSDLIVITLTLVGTQWAWYGLDKPVYFQLPGQAGYDTMPFIVPVVALALLWLFFLWAYKTRDAKILGAGTAEYKRVADATIRVWGIFAIIAFVLNFTIGQGYLLSGPPRGAAAHRRVPLVCASVAEGPAAARCVQDAGHPLRRPRRLSARRPANRPGGQREHRRARRGLPRRHPR